MEVTPQQMIYLIGQQRVEIEALKSMLQEAKAEIESLRPPVVDSVIDGESTPTIEERK